MKTIATARYEQALAFIANIPSCRSTEKRRLKIEALKGLGRKQQLIELLDPPQSADEATQVISLLLEIGQLDEATARLQASESLLTPGIINDLKATIAASKDGA